MVVADMTTHTSDLHETCNQFFINYPLAVRVDDGGEGGRSMVLMAHEGLAFFVLWLDYEKGEPVYSIGPWPAGDIAEISADGNSPVSDALIDALTYGVPIPRDGSIFGWTHHDAVTALVVVYAGESSGSVPSWTVMPLADAPEWQWPPFTDERFFGNWFWKYYWAGEVICLGDLVAGIPDTVFWVDAKATLGSDCCVVARNIRSSTGDTLQHGCYVYFRALRERKPLPSVEALLADADKVDLSPRYRQFSCGAD
jgi:hypothetical protein